MLLIVCKGSMYIVFMTYPLALLGDWGSSTSVHVAAIHWFSLLGNVWMYHSLCVHFPVEFLTCLQAFTLINLLWQKRPRGWSRLQEAASDAGILNWDFLLTFKLPAEGQAVWLAHPEQREHGIRWEQSCRQVADVWGRPGLDRGFRFYSQCK